MFTVPVSSQRVSFEQAATGLGLPININTSAHAGPCVLSLVVWHKSGTGHPLGLAILHCACKMLGFPVQKCILASEDPSC